MNNIIHLHSCNTWVATQHNLCDKLWSIIFRAHLHASKEIFYIAMVTRQEEWSPTLASGTGDWAETAPVPQVEEEGDGADHPRESEDKVFHQSLGCGRYGTVKSQLSNNIVQSQGLQPSCTNYIFIERGMEW